MQLPDGSVITDLSAPNDGIARVPQQQAPGDHSVAFWAATSSGQCVVLATHIEVDSDGDGLYNHWETAGAGVPYSTSTGAIGAIALSGADPQRKDLYVEIDAMNGFAPSIEALNLVQAAFSARGVTLHITLNELNISARNYSSVPFSVGDFYTDQQFGTAAERAEGHIVLEAKAQAYRYSLYAKNLSIDIYGKTELAPPCAPSCNPYNPAQSFIVFKEKYTELANENNVSPQDVRLRKREAATFMHELGHAMGLAHGGGDGRNFKPNYRSVMNGAFEHPFGITHQQFTLDYSYRAYPTLFACSLDERRGIQGDATKRIVVGPKPGGPLRTEDCPGSYHPPAGPWRTISEVGPVDWNEDSDFVDPAVPRDIVWLGPDFLYPDLAPQNAVLVGHNDWSNLYFAPPGRYPSSPVPGLVLAAGGEPEVESGVAADVAANQMESDCNSNGIFDRTDIANGTSLDANQNDFPDECEDQVSDVGTQTTAARGFSLGVFANPTRLGAETKVSFALPGDAFVTLRLLDVRGRELAVLAHGPMRAGPHHIVWSPRFGDGKSFPAGVYFAELRSAGATIKRKFVILK